jgi:hypothetical protein
MAKKRFLAGMLAMVLIFGMTVAGCEDGSTDDSGGGGGSGGDELGTPYTPAPGPGTPAATAGLYVGTSTTAVDLSAEAGDGLLAKSINWLAAHAAANTTYSILIDTNETIYPFVLSRGQLANLIIILKGLGTTERTIQLGSNGSFTVGANVMLTLDGYLTLKGRTSNIGPLVQVNYNGTLEMKGNSKITGNTSSVSCGSGGVYVIGGSFTMSGNATVSGNTASASASYGGGVYVSSVGVYVGSFTMSGNATVSGNTASASYSNSGGGGVYVGGSFTMSGGTISGNTASYSSSVNYSSSGGGVYVGGTFTKTGGVIYGSNEANQALRNVLTGQTTYGAAVCADSTHKRETTVGAGQNMSKSGSTYAGQWSD